MEALLALFLRSIRVETRLRSTYWMRSALVLLVLLEIASVHLMRGWIGAPGLALFATVAGFNAFFITLAGLSYFSSAITEEKEELTLGLLRMTSLSPLAILLGKSTSRLCGALFLLAAQFPFTLLAISLGGVTYQQIFAAYVSLGAYVFLLANVALCFSVFARRTATAAILTGLTLLAFHLLPKLITGAVWVLGRLGIISSPKPAPWLEALLARWNGTSAFARLEAITSTGFSESALSWQVTSNLVLGLIAFVLAWALFQRFADHSHESSAGRAWLPKKRSNLAAPGRAWSRALLWKDFHFLSGGQLGFALRFMICATIAALCSSRHWKKGDSWDWHDIGLAIAGLAGAALALDLALAASRIFHVEHKERTLSSLAQLPISIGALARQKILAAFFAATPQLLFVCVGLLMTLPETWRWIAEVWTPDALGKRGPPRTMVLAVALALVFSPILMLHLTAWLSLRVKWGALPLAFVLWIVGLQVMIPFAVIMFQEAAPIAIAVAEIMLTGILCVDIGRRLETLAGSD